MYKASTSQSLSLANLGHNLFKTTELNVNIAFSHYGSGDQTIVFLHGTSANFAVWNPIVDKLSKNFSCISLDQRGHGRSDKPDCCYEGDDFAEDVINVLNVLGIAKVIIVGHSLGARNAWIIAAKYPDRVQAIIAIDYVPYVEMPVIDTLATRVAGGDRKFGSLIEIRDYLQNRYVNMPKDAVERRTNYGYVLNNHNWIPCAPADSLNQVVDGFRTTWEKEFIKLNVPMVCVRGEHSAILSTAAWDKAKRAKPDACWITVKGVDHYIPEEKPDEIVNLIIDLASKIN